MQRRRAIDRREGRREKLAIVLISLFGCGFTIARALQSDAFAAVLIALGTAE
jgi:hypothetical protein